MTTHTEPARRLRAAALATLLALLVTPAGARAAHAGPAHRPVKYYVVATQYRGQPEFLYEIAQRFLGSGDRALEIFNLNRGRVEPGGFRVERPEVLRPGWVLQLPSDAKGRGVHAGPLPRVPDAAAPGTATGATATRPGPSATPPRRTAAAASVGAAVPAWVMWLALGVALLAAAGAGIWLVRSGRVRVPARRGRAAVPAHPDSSAAWTVDRSLRVLATACAQQNRPLPGVYAVVVGLDEIRLRLSAPDERPPSGWSVEQDGRTWTADLRRVQYAPVDDGPADPYPRLVTLGTTSDGRVLLNLAEAHGIVALTGDAAMQRRMAERWARELASNPWSRAVTVVRAGFGAAEPGPRTRDVPEVEQLWDALGADAGGVVLVARAPGGRDLERLGELAGRVDPEWAVVVLGGAAAARWQLALQPDGALDTGFLPEPVRTGLEAGQPRPALV
jgi:hypothetical protein